MEVYMGLIFPSAISYAPVYTDNCYGQQYAVANNSALFSLLGTYFGGNGSSTFNLPDLRGRVPVGIGNSLVGLNLVMGAVGGSIATTITGNNMPPHSHPATFTPTVGAAPISITVGTGGTGLNANVGPSAINGTLSISTGPGATNAPSSTNVPAVVPAVGGEQVSAYGPLAGTNTWPVGGTTTAQAAPVNGTISGNANMVNGGNVSIGVVGSGVPISNLQPYLGINYLIIVQGLYPPRP